MSQRTQRLGDQIQRDISGLIRQRLRDPRLGMVTVSAVKVSPDMGYADIYVTILGKTLDEAPDEGIAILNAASGILRGELGRGLRTRIVPHLRFHHDVVTSRGNRMAELITQAVNADVKNSAESEAASADAAGTESGSASTPADAANDHRD
ncbi:MAG: 30S ribosome-binding factor RbfA [Paraperlucidibaca sp.]